MRRTTPSNDDFFRCTVKMHKQGDMGKVAQVRWTKGDKACVRA